VTLNAKDRERLKGVDPRLVTVMERVALKFPCRIVEGVRSPERQKKLVAEGKSKTLNSKHLTGRAVDVAPLVNGKIDWQNITVFAYFGGYVMGIADGLGITLRHGADWDQDFDVTDHAFMDWPHFELVD
jgi:peptidoglycan LD-endopeptidase CwlK